MRLVTGQYVTMTELQNQMTIDDVDDLNIILEAEAVAHRKARKRDEA